MSYRWLGMWLIAFLFSAAGASAEQAATTGAARSQSFFQFENTDFGTVDSARNVKLAVNVRKIDQRPTGVLTIMPRSSKTASASFENGSADSKRIDVEVDVSGALGRVVHYFDIYEAGREEPIDSFAVRGFVDWVIAPPRQLVDLGVIDLSSSGKRVVEFAVRPGSNVELIPTREQTPYFSFRVLEDRRSLEISSWPDASWGGFERTITLKTNSRSQPRVSLVVRGVNRGQVAPSVDPVDFGLVREGEGAERLVRIADVEGKPLRLGSVTAVGHARVETEMVDCIPRNEACKTLRIVYPPISEKGSNGGVVNIEISSRGNKILPIRFGAIGIGKTTQIRDLAADMKAAQELAPSLSSALKASVTEATPPASMNTPGGRGPLLTWSVENESDIYGYEVYRSALKDGKFERVTDGIVRRLEQPSATGGIYRWRDTRAESGSRYWYYIETVYNSGAKKNLTEPREILAK